MFSLLKKNICHSLNDFKLLKNSNIFITKNRNYFSEDIVHKTKKVEITKPELRKDYLDEHKSYVTDVYKNLSKEYTYQEINDREFENFLVKMEDLMRIETTRDKKIKIYISDMRKISYQSREPIKDILINYSKMISQIGFDPTILSETMSYLGKVYKSRENFYKVYDDYSHWEFINSFRFYHMIDDLKFALSNENSFFNLEDIEKCIEGLILLEYKNTEIVEYLIEKMESLKNKQPVKLKKYEKSSDVPGMGKYNFFELNYRAKEIFYNENFKKHITKLMKIQTDQFNSEETHSKTQENNEISEITHLLNEVINILKETKETQYQIADSIDNLLNQYYTLEQLCIENPKITQNIYLKYELFKLQDKLISSGFLSVDTIKQIISTKIKVEDLNKHRYQNAIEILNDFSMRNFPGLFSRGISKMDQLLESDKFNQQYDLNSSRNLMNDENFGKCLAKLSEYARITHIDINGDDYINKKIKTDFINKINKNKEYAELKPSYTKSYNLIYNYLNSESVQNFIKTQLTNEQNLKAVGYTMYAMSNLKINLNQEFTKSFEKFLKYVETPKNIENLDNNDIIVIGQSLANNFANDKQTQKIVGKILCNVDFKNIKSIEEKLKLLWVMCVFKQYSHKPFSKLLANLSQNNSSLLNFLSNITTEFHNIVYQIRTCLKYEAEGEGVKIPKELEFMKDISQNIFQSILNIKQLKTVDTLQDPLKDMIVQAVRKGIFNKEIDNKFNLYLTDLESNGAIGNIPFHPDLLFGYYGNKIALFVEGRDSMISYDQLEKNGYFNIIKRILKNKFSTFSIFIPTEQIIKFDLKTLHLDLIHKAEFGTKNFIESLILKNVSIENEYKGLINNSELLNHFVSKISQSKSIESLNITEDSYFNSLLSVVDLNAEIAHIYSPNLLERKIIDMKVDLIKNQLIYETLPESLKNAIEEIMVQMKLNNYTNFIESLIENLSKVKFNQNTNSSILNQNLLGKRLTVDILTNTNFQLTNKNIGVEFINNNFMWLGEYNSYEDWEDEIRHFYDNFNYMVENRKNKYMFNSHKLGYRNTPHGIFPHPNSVTKIKKPLENVEQQFEGQTNYEKELKSYKNYTQKLVSEEIKKNEKLSQNNIPAEISLKVNLLNIKNCLKQNLNDNEIINFISRIEIIDNLISEHLNVNKNENQKQFLKRDSSSYFNFHKKLSEVYEQYDEYDKFIMREYYHQSNLFEIDEMKSPEENQKVLEERMKRKMDENDDNDSLSIYNPNEIDYKFDINGILSSQRIIEADSDLEKSQYLNNPDLFILNKRKLAERNLILLKIYSKLLQNKNLNELETQYLSKLNQDLQNSNLLEIENVGITNSVTNLKFSDLNANDVYSFNSLYNVELNEKINDYSLSELFLELSHFIDNSTILKIVHETFSKIHMNKYNIDSKKNISLFDINNKEPVLISNEVKENLWRLSGFFNEQDKANLREFLRVKRGKGKFDKIWLDIDESSLNDFISTSNSYDDRIKHLETWIKRKEKEFENRIQLPPDNLNISDTKINNLLEKKDKHYRTKLLSSIFKIEINQISTIDVHTARRIINKFISNLYLFNFEYPQTIKDLFNAFNDIPSLMEEDRQLLEHYKIFFNIEEKNPFEFLSVQPIKMETEKMNTLSEQEATLLRVQSANISFIEPLVQKILK